MKDFKGFYQAAGAVAATALGGAQRAGYSLPSISRCRGRVPTAGWPPKAQPARNRSGKWTVAAGTGAWVGVQSTSTQHPAAGLTLESGPVVFTAAHRRGRRPRGVHTLRLPDRGATVSVQAVALR